MISDSLGRFQIDDVRKFEWGTKLAGTFDYRDMRGQVLRGVGTVYVPPGEGPWPLHYQAGYEMADEGAAVIVGQGCVVVNPPTPEVGSVWPGENPLVRSVNLDVALLHIARSLDCIDDSRVTVSGGSAGGWMAWMLSAETFPLAAVMPDAGPVNWGYNASYISRISPLSAAGDGTLVMPGPAAVAPLAHQGVEALGADFRSDVWFQHSPVAHAEAITCPVHTLHATSDILVPVDQIARRFVRPPVPGELPDGFSTFRDEEWLFLEDVFPELHVEVIGVPDGAELLDIEAITSGNPPVHKNVELPDPGRRVVACILDDGPPGPRVGHLKYAVGFSRNSFLERVRSSPCDAGSQLTSAKRALLDKRARGEEWIASELVHLDFAEAERADVKRAWSHVA